MADSLLDNYNPLYDIHLRQYFALPHMQKHLQKMGLLESTLNLNGDEVYARHHAMMDMMLKNREAQLMKMAELRKKLDAAEKVEICRRIRSGQSPESYRKGKPSRSLSRSRTAQKGGRQRRFSNSFEDKDFVQNIERDNTEPSEYNTKDPYKRLSANAKRYNYLHKLDDPTLIAYKDNLKQQLQRLERFREISFGPHSVARQPPPAQTSWFFRRRSILSIRGRKTAPHTGNRLNASHDSRTSCPPTTRKRRDSNPRLPPITGIKVKQVKQNSAAVTPSARLPPSGKKHSPARGRPAAKRITTTTSTTTTSTITRSAAPSHNDSLPIVTGKSMLGGAAAAAAIGATVVAATNLIADSETEDIGSEVESHNTPTPTPPGSPQNQDHYEHNSTDEARYELSQPGTPEPTLENRKPTPAASPVSVHNDDFGAHVNEAFSPEHEEREVEELHRQHEEYEKDSMEHGDRSPSQNSGVTEPNDDIHNEGYGRQMSRDSQLSGQESESQHVVESLNMWPDDVQHAVHQQEDVQQDVHEHEYHQHEDVHHKEPNHVENVEEQVMTKVIVPPAAAQATSDSEDESEPEYAEEDKEVEEAFEKHDVRVDSSSIEDTPQAVLDPTDHHAYQQPEHEFEQPRGIPELTFDHYQDDVHSPVKSEHHEVDQQIEELEDHTGHKSDPADEEENHNHEHENENGGNTSPVEEHSIHKREVFDDHHENDAPLHESPIGAEAEQHQSPAASPVEYSEHSEHHELHEHHEHHENHEHHDHHQHIEHESPSVQTTFQHENDLTDSHSFTAQSPVDQPSPVNESVKDSELESPVVQISFQPAEPHFEHSTHGQASPVAESVESHYDHDEQSEREFPFVQTSYQQEATSQSPVAHSPIEQASPASQSPVAQASPAAVSQVPQSPVEQASPVPHFPGHQDQHHEQPTHLDHVHDEEHYSEQHQHPVTPEEEHSVGGQFEKIINDEADTQAALLIQNALVEAPAIMEMTHKFEDHYSPEAHSPVADKMSEAEYDADHEHNAPSAPAEDRISPDSYEHRYDEPVYENEQKYPQDVMTSSVYHTNEEHTTAHSPAQSPAQSPEHFEQHPEAEAQFHHSPSPVESHHELEQDRTLRRGVSDTSVDSQRQIPAEHSASPDQHQIFEESVHHEKSPSPPASVISSHHDEPEDRVHQPEDALTEEPDLKTTEREWNEGNAHIHETTTHGEYTSDDGTTHVVHTESVTVTTENSSERKSVKSDHEDDMSSPRSDASRHEVEAMNEISNSILDNGSTDSLVIHDEPSEHDHMTRSVYEHNSPVDGIHEKEWDNGKVHVHETTTHQEFTDDEGITHHTYTDTTVTTVTKLNGDEDIANNNDDEHEDKKEHEHEEIIGQNGNAVRESTTTSAPGQLPSGIIVDDNEEDNISSL